MAHKIDNANDALNLLKNKGVSLDTLASAIVRGKGLNQTESKTAFFFEYVKVSEELDRAIYTALDYIFNPEKSE